MFMEKSGVISVIILIIVAVVVVGGGVSYFVFSGGNDVEEKINEELNPVLNKFNEMMKLTLGAFNEGVEVTTKINEIRKLDDGSWEIIVHTDISALGKTDTVISKYYYDENEQEVVEVVMIGKNEEDTTFSFDEFKESIGMASNGVGSGE